MLYPCENLQAAESTPRMVSRWAMLVWPALPKGKLPVSALTAPSWQSAWCRPGQGAYKHRASFGLHAAHATVPACSSKAGRGIERNESANPRRKAPQVPKRKHSQVPGSNMSWVLAG